MRDADVRIGLLSGAAWGASRSTICRSLGHSLSAQESIDALSSQLDKTYRAVAANLLANPAARVETLDGTEALVLTRLDNLHNHPNLLPLPQASPPPPPPALLPPL